MVERPNLVQKTTMTLSLNGGTTTVKALRDLLEDLNVDASVYFETIVIDDPHYR